MVILSCSGCKKEVAWYLTVNLPEKWGHREGRDLCPDCIKKFDVFKLALDKEMMGRIDGYFSK